MKIEPSEHLKLSFSDWFWFLKKQKEFEKIKKDSLMRKIFVNFLILHLNKKNLSK